MGCVGRGCPGLVLPSLSVDVAVAGVGSARRPDSRTVELPAAWVRDAVLVSARPVVRLGDWDNVQAVGRYGDCNDRFEREIWPGEVPSLSAADMLVLDDFRGHGALAEGFSTQLYEGGRHIGAQLAEGVTANYDLALQVYLNIAIQPHYVKSASRSSSRLLRLVLSLAQRGFVHLRSLVTQRCREAVFHEQLVALGLLDLSFEDEALQDPGGLDAAGLQPQPSPDGPARAMPRETRAGPDDEDHEPSAGHSDCVSQGFTVARLSTVGGRPTRCVHG